MGSCRVIAAAFAAAALEMLANGCGGQAIGGSTTPPPPAAPNVAAMRLPDPEPARGQPVAWFRDHYIYDTDLEGTDLQALIISLLIIEFTQAHKLEPTEPQVQSFLCRLYPEAGTPEEREQNDDMSREMARGFVHGWLVDKAMYERYGGIVIFQQMNPFEPVGAYRRFLEDHEARGTFKILDPEHRKEFWSYFTSFTQSHYTKDQIDFSRPWWEQLPLR